MSKGLGYPHPGPHRDRCCFLMSWVLGFRAFSSAFFLPLTGVHPLGFPVQTQTRFLDPTFPRFFHIILPAGGA